MKSTKIIGLHSGHDCAYALLEDGVVTFHEELERWSREKEPFGDAMTLAKSSHDLNNVKYFGHTACTWKGGLHKRYPKSYKEMWGIITKNDGNFFAAGHHEAHAANAFYSSNFDEALVLTIDGGGRDYVNDDMMVTCLTAWKGDGIDLDMIEIVPDYVLNIGGFWSSVTRDVFGLSAGYPKGNQCGTIMAMAAFGNGDIWDQTLADYKFNAWQFREEKAAELKEKIKDNDQLGYDLAANLQRITELQIFKIVEHYLEVYPTKNLCLSGGVALNSVAMGKLLDKFPEINIYIPPVPPDSGLAIGMAQYIWHKELGIKNDYNATPYLGIPHHIEDQKYAIAVSRTLDGIKTKKATDGDVVELLSRNNIIAVYGGKSESGRRALGNRSILADPRSPEMKDLINEKVKHRQWFRPFAPSILREKVSEWFEKDIESPYMSFCLRFKRDRIKEVPAVVHTDGTARLQTVRETDNKWYYNLLKLWENKTGVPILLNTSFNDREPIVETPGHALKCFLGTDIDYLYFYELGILVEKNNDISKELQKE